MSDGGGNGKPEAASDPDSGAAKVGVQRGDDPVAVSSKRGGSRTKMSGGGSDEMSELSGTATSNLSRRSQSWLADRASYLTLAATSPDPARTTDIEAALCDLDDTLYPQSTWLDGAWRAVAAAAAHHGIDEAAFLAALQADAALGSARGGIINRALAAVGVGTAAPHDQALAAGGTSQDDPAARAGTLQHGQTLGQGTSRPGHVPGLSAPQRDQAPVIGPAQLEQAPGLGTAQPGQAPAVDAALHAQAPRLSAAQPGLAPVVGAALHDQELGLGTAQPDQAPVVGAAQHEQASGFGAPQHDRLASMSGHSASAESTAACAEAAGSLLNPAPSQPTDAAAVAALVDRLVAVFRAHRPGRLEPYPGVREALVRLRAAGVRLAVVTDGDVEVQAWKVRALGLSAFFECVVVSDALGGRAVRKPHGAPFLAALEGLGVAAGRCVVVGDRPDKDVMGAVGVDIRAIRVKTGEYRGADDVDGTWHTAADFPAAVDWLLRVARTAPAR